MAPVSKIKILPQIGDPILRRNAARITSISSIAVKNTIRKLVGEMRKNNLIGMAAPQIGISKQLFITELRNTIHRKGKEHDTLRVFINPRIVARSKTSTILDEGCGSLMQGTLFGPVKRPENVTVSALDATGKKFTLKATGLLAKVIQHEFDHLQGVLIIDKFSDTKKVMHKMYRQS